MFKHKEEKPVVAPVVVEQEKPEFPHAHNRHSGTTRGYSVEARSTYRDPAVIGGQVFDNRWRTVRFVEGAPGVGVPKAPLWEWSIPACGLYSYKAAEALRWWFLAETSGNLSSICLETRLIEHEIKYSVEATATEAKCLYPVSKNEE